MSIVAVIAILALALLPAAMLAVGLKTRTLHARHDLGPPADDIHPYRSRAEASRRTSGDAT